MATPSCVEWLGDDATSRSRGSNCARLAIELLNVAFDHSPLGAISPQSVTAILVDFDHGLVGIPGEFEADCLAPSARAEFQRSQRHGYITRVRKLIREVSIESTFANSSIDFIKHLRSAFPMGKWGIFTGEIGPG